MSEGREDDDSGLGHTTQQSRGKRQKSSKREPQDAHPSGDNRFALLDACMKRHRFAPDALIEVLHTAQELFGFLQNDILHYVAHGLKLPPSRVYGVATFYHFFSFAPKGQAHLRRMHGDGVLCQGGRCVAGGDRAGVGDDRGQDFGGRTGLGDDGPLPGSVRAGARGRLRRRGLLASRCRSRRWNG